MELSKGIEHLQILLFGTIAMAMLVVFIILFVVKYQSKRIQEQEERRKLIESNQEKILEAVLKAQEDEQKRISQDLHDELGSALALAKINIGQLSKSIADTAKQEIATDTYSIIDDALKNVRRLSRDLHPVLLEKFGLLDAIEALGKKFTFENLEIRIEKPGTIDRFERAQELNIFRIIQELFSNALKHSVATLVELRLEKNEDKLIVTYNDNGIGFNYNRYSFSEANGIGIGMVTIETRVRILNGTWELVSHIGQGTLITFVFPINTLTLN